MEKMNELAYKVREGAEILVHQQKALEKQIIYMKNALRKPIKEARKREIARVESGSDDFLQATRANDLALLQVGEMLEL